MQADPLHMAAVRREVMARMRTLTSNVERDDLIQEALLRVWLNTCRHGATSEADAKRLTRWAINDYLRRADHLSRDHRCEVGAGALRVVNMGDDITMDDLPDMDAGDLTLDAAAEREALERMAAAVDALPPRQREALMTDQADQLALAARWGTSSSLVSQTRKKAQAALMRAARGCAP